MSTDWIERARTGEEVALRHLYETHRPRTLRLAYSLLGDRDEAEDVMQDVMIYALRHLDQYDPTRAAFTTWLHTITVNRCRDRGRRQRTAVSRVMTWFRQHGPATEADPDDQLDQIDAQTRVGRALAGLTDLQREALVLREVEGLSFAEIGAILGIPLRTAQARVTGAYAALRKHIGEPAPAHPRPRHQPTGGAR